MNALRTLILPALLALTTLATLPAWAAGAVVTTPQVKAELVAHAPEGVAASTTGGGRVVNPVSAFSKIGSSS